MKTQKLLTIGGNPKIVKGDKTSNYLTAILHLSPANLSGFETCPGRSAGCSQACLNTAGRGRFESIQAARIKKTRFFFERQTEFLAQLRKELKAFQKKCQKLGKLPAVRLNGTSDILWEKTGIIAEFPTIQFYDYTAIEARFRSSWQLPRNYHLTFSLKENNDDKASRVLASGGNVAVVFRDTLPTEFMGKPVIDGTTTDLRFLDARGVIVGLLAKGKAKKDQSGFVRDPIVENSIFNHDLLVALENIETTAA
jgi:hypothetical protein